MFLGDSRLLQVFQTASPFQPFEFPRIQIHHDIIIQIHCMQTSENHARKTTGITKGMTKTWQGWHIFGNGWYVQPGGWKNCICSENISHVRYILRHPLSITKCLNILNWKNSASGGRRGPRTKGHRVLWQDFGQQWAKHHVMHERNEQMSWRYM